MKSRTRVARDQPTVRDELARTHALARLARLETATPEVSMLVEQAAGELAWINGRAHVLDHLGAWLRVVDAAQLVAGAKRATLPLPAAQRAAAHWLALELPALSTTRACDAADVLALDHVVAEYFILCSGTPEFPVLRFVAPALFERAKDRLYGEGGHLQALRNGRQVPMLHPVKGGRA